MDEYLTSSVIHWYEDLEDRLLEFLRFFPFVDPNTGVSSPRLAGIITETCNILDSLLREASEPLSTIGSKRIKRDELDITHFAALYAKNLHLPSTKSVVFVSPPRYIIPFECWKQLAAGGQYVPATWWTAYTKLKHNRIGDIGQATLRTAVESMCGLHQVIARLPDLMRATLRHEWLQASGYNPEWLIEELTANRKTGQMHLVESNLFAVPVGGSDQFPDDITQLRPASYVCSQRLVGFFGRL